MYALMISASLLQRLATFVMNQCLMRAVGPAIFGIAAVQLELLLSTLLFLGREGIRLATLKIPCRFGSASIEEWLLEMTDQKKI